MLGADNVTGAIKDMQMEPLPWSVMFITHVRDRETGTWLYAV